MPSRNRKMCRGYAGVFYVITSRKGNVSKEKIYYIRYRLDGRLIEEKAGHQFKDKMTPFKAACMRAARMEGRELSNAQQKLHIGTVKKEKDPKASIGDIWNLLTESRNGRAVNQADKSNSRRILALFEHVLPSELRTVQVEDFCASLQAEGLAPQTVKHILGLLRRIIRFGVFRGLCPASDPGKLRFVMPRVDNRKTECLTPEQAACMLAALDEEEDQVLASLVRFALVTGMRRGALLHLRWEDVDMRRGFITLRGDVAKKRRTDNIPLTDQARALLQALPQRGPYVFAAVEGPRDTGLRALLARVKKKVNLPADFRPLHGLRHTYASWLASSGKVDLYTLQRLLTHENPAMTQRYAHLADETVRRAAAVADVMYARAAGSEEQGE